MAFATTPLIGIDMVGVQQDVSAPVTGEYERSHRPLTRAWGSDGAPYICAVAGAAISANTATVTVNMTTGVATATGGTATSPGVALATGDKAWFKMAAS